MLKITSFIKGKSLSLKKFLLLIAVFFSSANFMAFFMGLEESIIPQLLPEVEVNSAGLPTISYPIFVPKGTGNLTPEIILTYNPKSTGSIVGDGWQLSGIDTIRRDSSFGIRRTADDSFYSDEIGRLIKSQTISNGYFAYEDSKDSLRVVGSSACEGGPCSWERKTGTGVSFEYGNIVRYAENSNVGKLWTVSRVFDRNGNEISINYDQSLQSIKNHAIPTEIIYGNGNYRILFEYQNSPINRVSFEEGGIAIQDKLISDISIFYENDKIEGYHFVYTSDQNSSVRLVRIERDGYEPINMDYANIQPSISNRIHNGSFQVENGQLNHFYKSSDNGRCSGSLNICASTLVMANPFTALMCLYVAIKDTNDCNVGIEKSSVSFADVDGDGRVDFARIVDAGMQTSPFPYDSAIFGKKLGKIQVNKASKQGDFVSLSSNSVQSGGFVNTEVTRIIPGDLNGDRKSDFLILEDYDLPIKIATSNGSSLSIRESNVLFKHPRPDKERWFYLRPDQKVYQHFVDLDNDGLTDLIQFEDGGLKFYKSNGSGFNSGVFLSGIDSYRFGQSGQQFVDLDGNGYPDFISFTNIDNEETRTLLYTMYGPSGVNINSGSVRVGTDGLFSNFYFADINGDRRQEYVSVTPNGDLKIRIFDGRNFQDPYVVTLEGVYFTKDLTKSSSQLVADPYLLDLKRDGSPLDKIIQTDTTPGAEKITLYLHDNSSQFNESIEISVAFPSGVYNGTTNITKYDLDKDGVLDDINVRLQSVTDLFLVIKYGSDNYIFEHKLDTSKLFAQASSYDQPDYPKMTDHLYDNLVRGKSFADVDGDGKDDFIWYDGSQIRVSYARWNSGKITFRSSGDDAFAAGGLLAVLDFDHDGHGDFVGINVQKQALFENINFLDVNRDTPWVNNAVITYYNQFNTTPTGFITSYNNGNGEKKSDISYTSRGKFLDLNSQSSVYPIVSNLDGGFLVRSIKNYSGLTETSETRFDYDQDKILLGSINDRKFLGFKTINAYTSLMGNPYTQTRYSYNHNSGNPGIGKLDKVEDFVNGHLLKTKEYSYLSKLIPTGTKVSLSQQTFETTDKNGLSESQINEYDYDSYGNILKETISIGSHTILKESIYNLDIVNNLLERKSREKVFSDGVLIKDESYEYNNHQLTRITQFADNPKSRSKVFTYDSFGNVKSESDFLGNISSYEYDAKIHLFQTKIVNPLGHVFEKQYEYKFGNLVKSIDPNGAVFEYEYDKFGRRIREKIPGNSDWSLEVEYQNTGRTGASIQKTEKISSSLEIVSKAYFDPFNRLIREEKLLENGSKLINTKKYYPNGNVETETEDELEGLSNPTTKYYKYDPIYGTPIEIINSNGIVEKSQTNGYETTVTVLKNGNELHKEIVRKNSLDQLVYRNFGSGVAYTYEYNNQGKLIRATDSLGRFVNFSYDIFGRKITQIDAIAGSFEFHYDANDNIILQRDSQGKAQTFTYDELSRRKEVKNTNGNVKVKFEYDFAVNGVGRVSAIQDDGGLVSFEYDPRGNISKSVRRIDDLVLVENATYDNLDRTTELQYPEGSIAHYNYSKTGYLSSILLDIPRAGSYNHNLVQYSVEPEDNDVFKINKVFGNGVKTEIFTSKQDKKVKSYKTTNLSGVLFESIELEYDGVGNVLKRTDHKNPSRTQEFVYDSHNRITNAIGKYGVESYTYNASGDILKKGNLNYQYDSVGMLLSVSDANQTTHTFNYDRSGKVIRKNTDSLSYDDLGRLMEYNSSETGLTSFAYDFSGIRIKKTSELNNKTVISLGRKFDVTRSPGNPDQYTLYFEGAADELIAQLSTSDAVLVAENQIFDPGSQRLALVGKIKNLFNNLFQYEKVKTYFLTSAVSLAFLLILPLSRRVGIKSATPFLLLCVLNLSNCGMILPGGGEQGNPPWLLFPTQINTNTPSIGTPIEIGLQNGTPVNGLVFFHTDHLGSTTKISDGFGNIVSGGMDSGASFVSYKPYGSILRNDSFGPDIFKFKYEGKEEDVTTKLLYYNSRYYDPEIGRFLQPDTQIMADQLFGMNRYMFVNGNPIMNTDPSGNNAHIHMFNQIIRKIVGADNKTMVRNIKKDILNAIAESDNVFLSLAAKKHIVDRNKRDLREAQRERAIVTGVMAVVAIISGGTMAFGLSIGSKTMFALALPVFAASVGYVAGSLIGYTVGGYIGSGKWDERSAIMGSAIGGMIGGLIGGIYGMTASNNILVGEPGNPGANAKLGEDIFGKGKYIFGPNYSPGYFKIFMFVKGALKSVGNIANNKPNSVGDLALDILNLTTPVPFITISDYNDLSHESKRLSQLGKRNVF
ncbi:RHS repeat-associated core domain-containing protein [Leptospira bouyouniensis]|uniref:RHS repeat-associated core domain-containing protein n=1 Tax=Leptospira bouyouniensis TaxID=2484911 RepID=UPI0014385B53|nr:RHS repeat-associated core domain-containing protein [Leptospira bouyouniensis]